MFISFNSLGQKNFNADYKEKSKCIRKAEKEYTKGKYIKSLKSLDKANEIQYPSCGNLANVNSNTINGLRFKNYLQLGKYNLARTYLDSVYYFGSNYQNDSLRWYSYQIELGADSLSSIIDNSLENIIYVDSGFYHFVYVPLPNEFNYAKFTLDYLTISKYKGENKSIEARKEYWISEFKKSTIYAMIKR